MRVTHFISLIILLNLLSNPSLADITGRPRVIDTGVAVWDDRLAETLLEALAD